MDTFEHLQLSAAAGALQAVRPFLEEAGLPTRNPKLWEAIVGVLGELQYVASVNMATPLRDQIAELLELQAEFEHG